MKTLPWILACALILLQIPQGGNDEAWAQLPQDLCPPPAQWIGGGNGSFVCRCPDGRLLSLGQTCGVAAPPQVGGYCSNGETCPVGSQCSWMVGRCVPNGKVDCGSYYCDPGNKCSSAGCIRAGAVDCANGSFCNEGQKCSQDGKRCLAANAVDCGTYACNAGQICAPNGQCWPQGAIACGNSYCQRGFVCTGDNRCLTSGALAAERAGQLDRATCADDAASVTEAVAACSRRITAGQLRGRDLAVTYFQRGNALKRRLDFDGALADYDKAVSIDPTFAAGYVARGYIRYNKDLIDEATTDFERAIQLEPSNALAYNNLAWMRYRKHDFARALIDANKALEIAPALSIALSTRGEIKRVQGDIDGAISDLNRALASEPDSVFSLVGRGLAYWAKGDREKAIADLRQALTLPTPDVDRRLAHHMAEEALPDLIAEQQNPIRRWLSDVGLTRDRWPIAIGFVLVLGLALASIALRKQIYATVSAMMSPPPVPFRPTSAATTGPPIRQHVEPAARPPAPAQAPQPESMQAGVGGRSQANEPPKPQPPVEAYIRKPPNYDQVKWKALTRYDPDIAAAVAKIQPLGQIYLDELAQAFFDLNDKAYLPKIVEKLTSHARGEAIIEK